MYYLYGVNISTWEVKLYDLYQNINIDNIDKIILGLLPELHLEKNNISKYIITKSDDNKYDIFIETTLLSEGYLWNSFSKQMNKIYVFGFTKAIIPQNTLLSKVEPVQKKYNTTTTATIVLPKITSHIEELKQRISDRAKKLE
jgi:hypothetical protein